MAKTKRDRYFIVTFTHTSGSGQIGIMGKSGNYVNYKEFSKGLSSKVKSPVVTNILEVSKVDHDHFFKED